MTRGQRRRGRLVRRGCGLLAVLATACAPNGQPSDVAGASTSTPAPEATLASAVERPSPTTRPDHVDSADAEPPRVAVVGDSLSVAAEEEIRSALEALEADIVAFDARVARRMESQAGGVQSGVSAIELLRSELDPPPDVWVIALGTNDVGARSDDATLDEDIGAVLKLVGTQSLVVWVDVYVAGLADDSADFDARLEAEAADRDWLAVAEWSSSAQESGVLISDGVHLTDLGEREFAEVIARSVSDLLHADSAGATETAN